MSLLLLDFMLRALLAAVFTGLSAPAVGTYLVQRRLALLGDGLGHVAVLGVAVGLLTATSPTVTAVVVATLGAVVLEVVRERGSTSGDVALAMLFYGGISAGLVVTGLAGQTTATLQQYLFGSITTVSGDDVLLTGVFALVVVVLALGLSPQLFAVAQDPEFARVAGVRVRVWNLVVAVLAALTVTVAMRTVGLLLVSALMVVPVATAQQVTRSFRDTLLLAMGLGVTAAVGGVVLAALVSPYADLPPGATIVLLSLGLFVLTWPFGVWRRHRQRLLAPFTDEPLGHEPADEHVHDDDPGHEHDHGPECGHPAVPHGDHVDYLHDGHRHASHGSHYDEH